MVHIDYETQKRSFLRACGVLAAGRTLKKSAKIVGEVAKTNVLKLPSQVLEASNFVMIEEGAGTKTTKDAPPSQKEAAA